VGRPADRLRRHRPALRWVLALALVGVVVFVGASVIDGFAAGATAIVAAKPTWLVGALLAEVVAYLLLAEQLRGLLGPEARISRRRAGRLAMVLCGFGCITPASPAEGMVITGADLRRRGVPMRRVSIVLGLAECMSALAIVALSAANVLVAGSLSDLPTGEVLPFVGAAMLVLAGVGAVHLLTKRPSTAERLAVVLGGLCFWRPRPSVEARRAAGQAWHAEATAVVGGTSKRVTLLALAAGAWLADVLCCYLALASLGVVLPFDVVFLAYTVGVLATLVPFLPAGLGLVETAVPLVLHGFGAPLGAAVAGVLAYRCVSTLLPAAVGLACIPGLGVRRSAPTHPALVSVPAADAAPALPLGPPAQALAGASATAA
jgi:uncharacterized protein (TIRG00374 family)